MTGVPCCMERGVPKECYGFCINPESSDSRRLDSRSDRPNLCTKYKEIAAECELGYRKGNYNLFILVLLHLCLNF